LGIFTLKTSPPVGIDLVSLVSQPLPQAWSKHFLGEIGEQIKITVECGRVYTIHTAEKYGNLFLTKGWDVLVTGEMLSNSDIGLFTYVGPSCFTMRVFNTKGVELPHIVLWADSFLVEDNAAHKRKATISGTRTSTPSGLMIFVNLKMRLSCCNGCALFCYSDTGGIQHSAGLHVTDAIRTCNDAVSMTNPSSAKVFLGKITGSQLGSGVMVTKRTILPFLFTDVQTVK
jgi:hypothetical protein